MNNRNSLSVCFTPNQFEKYSHLNSTVVVVDLLRATSVISTAFECGIESIIPVDSLDEAKSYEGFDNHIIAAERNTLPIDGFSYGNSPFHYLNANVKGRILVLTTTNGTKAINIAKGHKVITASFLNIRAVAKYLINDNNSVIILCSGWKNLFNLEDSVFAGALAEMILDSNAFFSNCDSLLASIALYSNGKGDLFNFLKKSAYRNRSVTENLIKDTKFCLNPSITSEIIPIYFEERLIRNK